MTINRFAEPPMKSATDALKHSLASTLFALLLSIASLPAHAFVAVTVNIGPPELPVYEQPIIPGDGYLWTPGYWAYADGDYFWVPGTWVRPPRPRLLWTPGYWGYDGRVYVFRPGYWGPRVGYYGGINYGYGYGGRGYEGGRWDGDRFSYNRTVNNVNVTNVHNTYNKTVINNITVNRVSFNGGNGGTDAQPTAEEKAAEREKHVNATSEQTQHERTAESRPELRRAANNGRPAIGATAKADAFDEKDVVRTKDAAPGRPDRNDNLRAENKASMPATADTEREQQRTQRQQERREKRQQQSQSGELTDEQKQAQRPRTPEQEERRQQKQQQRREQQSQQSSTADGRQLTPQQQERREQRRQERQQGQDKAQQQPPNQ